MPEPYPLPRELPIPPMDKASGHKDTAFTWAMGELILARIWAGDTMKAITADPRMPAYCTVYRWMQVVPDFGLAVADLRAKLAEVRAANGDAARRRGGPARNEARTRRPRTTGACSAAALGALLARIRGGASVSEAVTAPGAPSVKTLYRRVETCPGFRMAFVDACDWRNGWLGFEAELVVDEAFAIGIPAANAKIARLKARRGQLTPKHYRTPPTPLTTG